MRKLVFSTLLVAAAMTQAHAGAGGKTKKFTAAQINQTTRLVRHTEPSMVGKTVKPGNYGDALARLQAKRAPGSNSVQDNIAISTLGESINPFTVIGNGKTNLFAHPPINTIAFIRRGGPTDPGGASDAPGNKLFYDVNTRGGSDGNWQISRGPLFTNDLYDLDLTNHAPRYPQGLIWAPSGSTDTNQAVVFSQMPVLDGSNGASWGGQGRGWQPLSSPVQAPKQSLSPSGDPLHYISEGMALTSTGKIFFIDPERDLSTGSVVYNNRVTVYGMSYNSATNDWDSTIVYIPFNGTAIASSSIEFGPDGTTGYIVLFATSPDYGITTVYAPFVSKTTDGGLTWSEFHLVNLNPEAGAGADSLRKQWLGSWVNFQSDGAIVGVEANSPYSHKVQYSTSFDLDISVDKYNYCHIMTAIVVAGFTDTLEAADPPTIRSALGQWLTDVYLNDPYFPSGFVFDQVKALRGCWGDCAGTENFTEDNRPQTTRSWDGSIIGFCYFDTDTGAYEPVEGNENSNPDMWVRLLRADAPGEYRLTTQVRNKTTGSNAGGQVICGNVSPFMLPSTTSDSSFIIPVSAILLSSFDGATSPWPVTHLYVDGVTISSKYDSFPVKPRPVIIDGKTNPKTGSLGLDMILSPNPAKNSISAALFVSKGGDAVIAVTNSLGQIVDRKTLKVSSGDVRIPFNTSSYKGGIYFLNASVGDQRISKRFIKE